MDLKRGKILEKQTCDHQEPIEEMHGKGRDLAHPGGEGQDGKKKKKKKKKTKKKMVRDSGKDGRELFFH